MLVVDFMHEVELGVWKALFTHLIRILDATASLHELDKRYDHSIMWIVVVVGLSGHRFRDIPAFSQTIHRFTNNVSEMKKLAARDYEDMLQVR